MQPITLILMYHKVSDDSLGLCPKQFEAHMDWLKAHFTIVHPGETKARFQVCLTFDDATFDFYHVVWPILKAKQIPAVLAVTPEFILDTVEASVKTRLNQPVPCEATQLTEAQKVGFCSWEEIAELNKCPWVQIASHSKSHANQANPSTDIADEVHAAKAIFDSKGISAQDFVYPYGRRGPSSQSVVTSVHRYAMRIGGALNFGWPALLLRLDAEMFWPKHPQIPFKVWVKLLTKTIISCFRK